MYRPRTVCTSSGSALGSTYSPRAVHMPYTVKTMRQLLHVCSLQFASVLHTCTCTSIHNHYTRVHIIHRTCPTSVHVHKSPDPISMYIYTCMVLKARVAQGYVKSPFLRCMKFIALGKYRRINSSHAGVYQDYVHVYTCIRTLNCHGLYIT